MYMYLHSLLKKLSRGFLYKQTNKWTERWTDGQTDRQTDNTDKDSQLDNQKVSKGGQKSVHLSYLHVHVATMMQPFRFFNMIFIFLGVSGIYQNVKEVRATVKLQPNYTYYTDDTVILTYQNCRVSFRDMTVQATFCTLRTSVGCWSSD